MVLIFENLKDICNVLNQLLLRLTSNFEPNKFKASTTSLKLIKFEGSPPKGY